MQKFQYTAMASEKICLLTESELETIIVRASKMVAAEFMATQKQHQSQHTEEPYLSIAKVSAELSISRVTLRKWERDGLVKPHRIGRRVYFRRSDLIKGEAGK